MLVETITSHPIVQAALSHPIVEACVNAITANSVIASSVTANTITANSVIGNSIAIATTDAGLYGDAGAIMGMAAMAGPMLSIGLIGNYMTSGTVLPIYFAYGGLMMVVVMSMLGSAYAIVKIVDAAVKNSVSGSYYYTYHSDNQLGNFMGMWELLNVLVFLTWSMIIMILGMVIGAQMWEKFELLEAAGELTQLEGFKYLLLGFIMAAGIWVASLNVGDMSSSMLGIFDSYNTKIEAINTDGDKDTKGTALFVDVGVHLIETYVTMSVVSSIVIYAVGTLLTWA